MVDEGDGGRCGPTRLVQAQHRRDLEEELRDLSNQVAVLGRSLAEERGRSLAAGGALRALEIAVGGAQARVGGAYRARDRACERLRQQQEAGHLLWAELEAARVARAGAELRAREAESQCRAREAELERLRQAVAAAQHARRRAEQERDDLAAHVPHPPSPTGGQAPGGLQAALAELREHNRELQQRLHQRRAQAEELRRALAAAGARAREAAGARARLEQEQRVLRGRLQHPGVPPGPAEAALRARCLHLQELLHREAGARAALARAGRAAGRRLRVLLAEVEEQRLRGERYRLQVRPADAVAHGAPHAAGGGRGQRRRQQRQRVPALGPRGAPRNRPPLVGGARNRPQGPPPKGFWSWGWPESRAQAGGGPLKPPPIPGGTLETASSLGGGGGRLQTAPGVQP
ncbi:myosin-14 isoform X3 [Tyto alba]|uniref:myosin-14 isoform X3 n=1 Tax=Tyto alba TaxID=56313 RepID=UPI001C662F01|nr:myosin-14 isoform X3 [Tyto alba]